MAYLKPLNWYTLALFEPGSMIGLHEMGALVVVLGVSLLITVIIFIIGQNQLIIRPLSQLSQGAQRMSSGDYAVRLPVTQRDEIGDLTQTFNDMAATIADYTGNLENKVAERTHELSEAYEVIRSSIRYASRIQRSVLPDISLLEERLADYFVYWEPRDVVGGDIYWNDTWGEGLLLILGDCTGHGVPGAFMTLIATGALDRAKMEVPRGDIAALAQRMHQLMQITLRQNTGHSESDDGMELGICYLPADMTCLTFSGARFELFVVDNGQVSVIKGTKQGIGYCSIPLTQEYDTQTIRVHEGMRFYMTSDGLIDQLGGPKRLAFGKKRFKELLVSMEDLSMKEQKARLQSTFRDFQGPETRRDDVSVIGFRI
jgi:serine phosphatase RsbU (regulator of sigma subunit)